MSNESEIKIIECPRDAMQGIKEFIPTKEKIRYINALLKVGFDTIDFGSFVSASAVPQMKDTVEVLNGLDLVSCKSKLLAIVANQRGGKDAGEFEQIHYLGFPLSLSETFQQKNTNKSIEEAFTIVGELQDICSNKSKKLVVYLSMGFGNPYGDPYDKEYIVRFTERLYSMGIRIISLSDTVGVADVQSIQYLFTNLIPAFSEIEFGAHLHSTPFTAKEKILAAYDAGCRRFDGAIKGFGGCPMATDELTGNIATEMMIEAFEKKGIDCNFNKDAFKESLLIASEIFPA